MFVTMITFTQVKFFRVRLDHTQVELRIALSLIVSHCDHFDPSLIFVGKVGASPSGALRVVILFVNINNSHNNII
jgi:hypothetical protein